MLKRADLITEQVQAGAGGGPVTQADEDAVRHIFRVLHGLYGNLFFSKFQTGRPVNQNDPNSEDEGVANARRIWAYSLREFDGATIKAALRDVRVAHPEFPPSEPQFAAICRARAPRGPAVLRDGTGAPRVLEMDQKLRSRYARQAREINERHAQRALDLRVGKRDVPQSLDGLKQAIADAVGAAGGDEGAELLRLDRMFHKASHA